MSLILNPMCGIGILLMGHGLGSPSRVHMSILLAEEFHDIAPPVDYSLIPPWGMFVATFIGLSLLGLLGWLFAARRKAPRPPKLPRRLALEELDRISRGIQHMEPCRV